MRRCGHDEQTKKSPGLRGDALRMRIRSYWVDSGRDSAERKAGSALTPPAPGSQHQQKHRECPKALCDVDLDAHHHCQRLHGSLLEAQSQRASDYVSRSLAVVTGTGELGAAQTALPPAHWPPTPRFAALGWGMQRGRLPHRLRGEVVDGPVPIFSFDSYLAKARPHVAGKSAKSDSFSLCLHRYAESFTHSPLNRSHWVLTLCSPLCSMM